MNKLFLIYLSLISLNLSFSRDISSFSNYGIIQQTNVELSFNVDFNNKVVEGIEKIYFTALKDGEVIILDTRALIIHSIIDSDTGEELEFIIDKQYELDGLGVPLKIYREFQKDEKLAILLKYNTTEDGMSIDWLDPEQTSGKKYPYMYSQGDNSK